MKYYAVKEGRNPGIYTTWEECEKEVKGYSGALYKSFPTLDEAKKYLGLEDTKTSWKRSDEVIAYVDGSFNVKTMTYGYGVVLIDQDRVIKELYGDGNHTDYVSMRNVSGEIFGSEVAIRYAIKNNYKKITIYYDYEGIEKWADNIWKTNKPGTMRYKAMIAEFRQKIQIEFVKVAAHTGVEYNERADFLAKKAVGINENKGSNSSRGKK